MKLPTLYKKTSTGKLQEWTISVDGHTIVTRYGQTGGAIQEAREEIKEGKNIGRANETTAEEQALAEAKSEWTKKKKAKGYVETVEAAMAGEVDGLVEGGYAPMLAHRFDEHGEKKANYPGYFQPKLNGHRVEATVVAGKCTLWSRTRKPITSLPHIIAKIEERCKSANLSDVSFDGEGYNHDFRDNLEKIGSIIRKQEATSESILIQYHTYDMPLEDTWFIKRFIRLSELLGGDRDGHVRVVQTLEVRSVDDVLLAFQEYRKLGYEGGIFRNAAGLYVGKRSYDLLKVKEFVDEEFEVVGVEEGSGKMAGRAIFVCKTKEGKEFRAKMVGPLENLEQYVKKPGLAVGRQLTVKFQNYSQDGLPYAPVAIQFREDI